LTLCIAAVCEYKKKDCIVLCSDRKITQGDTSSETGDKLSWFIPRWPTVYAGTIGRAQELIDAYRKELKGRQFKTSTILNIFKRVPLAYKKRLQDERAHQLVGLSYAHFLKRKSSFPKYEDLLDVITNPDIECELILAGFFKKDPYLFVVGTDASVAYEDDFAAIGSGADLAIAVLRDRKQHSGLSLSDTLYRVYEAKRFAQMEAHVGTKTFVDIVFPYGKDENKKVRIRSVSKKGRDLLAEYRRKFGPQPIGKIKIPPSYFRSY
jgi:20S proteasome alpha/beta subunit